MPDVQAKQKKRQPKAGMRRVTVTNMTEAHYQAFSKMADPEMRAPSKMYSLLLRQGLDKLATPASK